MFRNQGYSPSRSPLPKNYQYPYDNPIVKLNTAINLPKQKFRTHLSEFDPQPSSYSSQKKHQNYYSSYVTEPQDYRSNMDNYQSARTHSTQQNLNNNHYASPTIPNKNQSSQTESENLDLLPMLVKHPDPDLLHQLHSEPNQTLIQSFLSKEIIQNRKQLGDKLKQTIDFLKLLQSNLEPLDNNHRQSVSILNLQKHEQQTYFPEVGHKLDLEKVTHQFHQNEDKEHVPETPQHIYQRYSVDKQYVEDDEEEDEKSEKQFRVYHKPEKSIAEETEQSEPDFAEEFKYKAENLNNEIRNIINSFAATSKEKFNELKK